MHSKLKLVLHAIPSLIAIVLSQVVTIQIYQLGFVSQNQLYLLGWLALQMIPGFLFSYVSDRFFRKKALIISQALGLIGGIFLIAYGFENWIIILISLTFNPIPVARAAFIDNFPKHSMLQLIGLTLLAQYIPWACFDFIGQFNFQTVVLWIVYGLLINIILTFVFFEDNYDDVAHSNSSLLSVINKIPISLTLLAFILAEATFYIYWSFLETTPTLQMKQSVETYGTLAGISLAMLYNRLPHISVITLFYHIGAGTLLIVFLRCLSVSSTCDNMFMTAMSHYTVVGGMYLPFVTVALINMFGSRNKALGSASVEFGDTVAAVFSPAITFLVNSNISSIVLITVILYFGAAFFQRKVEIFITPDGRICPKKPPRN